MQLDCQFIIIILKIILKFRNNNTLNYKYGCSTIRKSTRCHHRVNSMKLSVVNQFSKHWLKKVESLMKPNFATTS